MLRLLILSLCFCCTISSCRKPEPRRASVKKSGHSLDASAERTRKRLIAEKNAIELYIKNDSTHTYNSSNHGLWYTYISKEMKDEPIPKYGNKVTYTYSLQDLNNNFFYTSEENGIKTHYIKQENIMEGLRRAFTVIRDKEEIKFLLPSQLAYGYKGDLEKIAPNTPLIMTVKLVTIEQTKNQ